MGESPVGCTSKAGKLLGWGYRVMNPKEEPVCAIAVTFGSARLGGERG